MNERESQQRITSLVQKYMELLRQDKAPSLKDYLDSVSGAERPSLLEKLLPAHVKFRSANSQFSELDYRELGEQAVLAARQINSDYSVDTSRELDNTIVVGGTPTEHRAEISRVWSPGNEVIPGYQLVKKLGEGGMGTVWEAEQSHPVRRKVALKVIRGDLGSDEILNRFEVERQALAIMNHPHIAQVYDAGSTQAGNPYFVMELVDGVPLNEYCDSKKLSCQARLKLIMQVCRAIQHAHQKGVVYRDLKPANVLVTDQNGAPHPKVIDFGLAKALEETVSHQDFKMTQAGQIVGTIEYMSPEQAVGDITNVDTRSDVYSLGIMLYEQMTGMTPLSQGCLKSEPLDQILRFIREGETIKPSRSLNRKFAEANAIPQNRSTSFSALGNFVGGDLDWVILKALEKDIDRRYESAGALARDVQRFVDDEPVEARSPTSAYLLKKFYQRNFRQVQFAAIVTGLLAAGLVAFFWQWNQTNKAQQRSQLLAASEKTARAEARQSAIDIANTIAASVRNSMLEGNGDAVREVLKDIRRDLPRAEITIYDPYGEQVFGSQERQASADDLDPAFLAGLARTREDLRENQLLHHPIINKPNCRECHDSGSLRGVLAIDTSDAAIPIDTAQRECEVVTSLIKSGFIQLMTANHQNIVEEYIRDVADSSGKVVDVTIYDEAGNLAYGDRNAEGPARTIERALQGETIEMEFDKTVFRCEPLFNEDRCKGCHDDDLSVRGAILVSTRKEGSGDLVLAEVTNTSLEHIMLTGLGRLISRYLDDEKATGAVSNLVLYDAEGKVYYDAFAEPEVPDYVAKALENNKSVEVDLGQQNSFVRLMLNEKRCQQCHGSDLEVRGAVEVKLSADPQFQQNE